MFVGIEKLPIKDQQETTFALGIDRKNFFSLADKVLGAARTRNWDIIVTDYVKGHFVKVFLENVLTASGVDMSQMRFVDAVNSSNLFGQPDRAAKQQEALARLFGDSDMSDQRVLIVTEFVATGEHINRLAALAVANAAQTVDLAAMAVAYNEAWPEWSAIIPGECYIGGYPDHSPSLNQQPHFSTLRSCHRGSGFTSGMFLEAGVAEPQPLDFYPEYVEGMHMAIKGLAERYVDQVEI